MHARLLIGALTAIVVAPATASAASHTIVVRKGAVVRIGDFSTTGRAGSTIGGAIQAFGRPSSRVRFAGRNGCRDRWATAGIRAVFADFGAGEACLDGRVQNLTVRTRPWRTQRGLHVGDRVGRLRRLHPAARLHRKSWWLYTAVSPFGPTPTRYPLVRARVDGGRVTSLTAEIGAAGE
jgi:hypothetical protein